VKKLPTRRAAFVLSTCALALAASMLPAQAASTGWRTAAIVKIKGHQVVLSGVTAVGARNAWAAGGAATAKDTKPVGIIEHWAGKSWAAVKLPAKVAKSWNRYGMSLPIIGASSSSNVWAFSQAPGQGSQANGYVRLSGRKWTFGVLPGTSSKSGQLVLITATEVLGHNDVWAFGGKLKASASGSASFSPYAAQFNGRKWLTRTVPGHGAITAASVISPSSILAVIGSPAIFSGLFPATSGIVQWNGHSWGPTPVQTAGLPAKSNLTGIVAQNASNVWIAGSVPTISGGTSAEFIAALGASSWTVSDLKGSAASKPTGITSLVPDGSGGLWAMSESLEAQTNPELWHFTDGTAGGPIYPTFGVKHRFLFQLAAVPGTASVWGVGAVIGKTDNGLIGIQGPAPR
jgi:hypothetical protein